RAARRALWLAWAAFAALGVLDLVRRAPKQPLGQRACRAHQWRRQAGNELTVGPHREVMQGDQRNVVILRDVGSGLLEVQAGVYQVGPVRQRRQRRARLPPVPGNGLPQFAQRPDRITEQLRPKVADEVLV